MEGGEEAGDDCTSGELPLAGELSGLTLFLPDDVALLWGVLTVESAVEGVPGTEPDD